MPETIRGYARKQVRWNQGFYRELPRAYRALREHLSSRYLELRRPATLGGARLATAGADKGRRARNAHLG